MGDAVYPQGQATDHGDAILRQPLGQAAGHLLAIGAGMARAHHGHGELVRWDHGALDIKDRRWLGDVTQEGRVVGALPGEYPQSQGLDAGQNGVEVKARAEGQEVLHSVLRQAGGAQRGGLGLPGGLDIAKVMEQRPKAHRPDPRHQVETEPVAHICHQPAPRTMRPWCLAVMGSAKALGQSDGNETGSEVDAHDDVLERRDEHLTAAPPHHPDVVGARFQHLGDAPQLFSLRGSHP